MKSLFFIAAAFCLLLAPSAASACSCSTGQPSDEFNEAKAVFIGRMLGGTEAHSVKGRGGAAYHIEAGQVRFTVEEVFKGDVGGEVTVDIASMKGTSCGTYGLSRGERYLVYAYRGREGEDRLFSGVCTRTSRADGEDAEEDLDFLRNLPPAGTGGHLRGSIRADLKAGGPTPLPGVQVTIRGGDDTVLTATTDSDGQFEVRNLKPGLYRVEPKLPAHHTSNSEHQVVRVDDRGTASVWFEAYASGRVSGRVVDADGRGFDSAFLKLVGQGKTVNGHSRGDGGAFEVRGVPPGEYVLYLKMRHRDYQKERSFYHPGTFRRAEATAIRVGPGESVEGVEFRLPEGYAVRSVEGQVVWDDGRPAAGVEVRLLCPQGPGPEGLAVEYTTPSVRTDEDGRFRAQGLTGETYWLEAYGWARGEELWRSPLRKLALKEDLTDVRLVLSEKGNGKGCP